MHLGEREAEVPERQRVLRLPQRSASKRLLPVPGGDARERHLRVGEELLLRVLEGARAQLFQLPGVPGREIGEGLRRFEEALLTEALFEAAGTEDPVLRGLQRPQPAAFRAEPHRALQPLGAAPAAVGGAPFTLSLPGVLADVAVDGLVDLRGRHAPERLGGVDVHRADVHPAAPHAPAPARQAQKAALHAHGHERCAGAAGELARGGEDLPAVPGPALVALGEEAHGVPRLEVPQDGLHGVGPGGGLAPRDRREEALQQSAHEAQAENVLAGDEVGLLVRQAHGHQQRVPGAAVVRDDEGRAIELQILMRQIELALDPAVQQTVQPAPDPLMALPGLHARPSLSSRQINSHFDSTQFHQIFQIFFRRPGGGRAA